MLSSLPREQKKGLSKVRYRCTRSAMYILEREFSGKFPPKFSDEEMKTRLLLVQHHRPGDAGAFYHSTRAFQFQGVTSCVDVTGERSASNLLTLSVFARAFSSCAFHCVVSTIYCSFILFLVKGVSLYSRSFLWPVCDSLRMRYFFFFFVYFGVMVAP
jgi:hypothetical protein